MYDLMGFMLIEKVLKQLFGEFMKLSFFISHVERERNPLNLSHNFNIKCTAIPSMKFGKVIRFARKHSSQY